MSLKGYLAPLIALLAMIAFSTSGSSVAYAAQAHPTKCDMTFSMKGWSAFYETMSGFGTIRCDNGQSSKVKLRIKGGGLTAGVSRISGVGHFSDVYSIKALYGAYARGGAHAGAVKSASAQTLSKDGITLSITGKGSGVDLGISVGNLRITPIK